MRRLFAIFILISACDDPKPGAPPIAGVDPIESTTTVGDAVPGDCLVLFGCQRECPDGDTMCMTICEDHSAADLLACYAWRCDAARQGCFDGDPEACAAIPSDCEHGGGSSGSSGATTESGSGSSSEVSSDSGSSSETSSGSSSDMGSESSSDVGSDGGSDTTGGSSST